MTSSSWLRVTIAAFAVACLGYVVFANISIQSDLTFFQPRLPSRAAQLAIDQVRSGPASRLILVSLTNASPAELAKLSQALAESLSGSNSFSRIANGAEALDEAALQFVFERRYLLEPALGPDAFNEEGLKNSIASALQQLSGLSGLVTSDRFPADPTGRLAQLLEDWRGGNQPHYRHGVWFSRDESMVLLLAITSADGDDFGGQLEAQGEIEAVFSRLADAGHAQLRMTGPPVFSRLVSQSIQNQAWMIGLGSIAIVVLILAGTFRSVLALIIIALPTAMAAISGAAAVQLIFGSVHGIALTFGAVIVSVTSDYPVHLMSHLPGSPTPAAAVRSIISPLGLGAATTALAFLPMTLSSFPGLAQLGVFASVGVAVAALMTVFAMPLLLGTDKPRPVAGSVNWLLPALSWARLPLVAVGVAAALWLSVDHAKIFSDDLSRLNPLPRDLVDLDKRLRDELGAPDVRRLFVIDSRSAEDALVKSEQLAAQLDSLIDEGAIASYDAPSRYLPSAEAQKRQQALLPSESELRRDLAGAIQGLPVELGTFEPFIRDVIAAKSRNPIEAPELLPVPLLGDRLASLLQIRNQESSEAFILLSDVSNPDKLASLGRAMSDSGVHYLDLQAESTAMIASYRAEALRWLVVGLAVVTFVLVSALSFRRAVLVLLTLVVSISTTTALLVALDLPLTPFNLVALLLVAGMGLDYALFMSRDHLDAEDGMRTVRSVVICALTTIAAFSLMVFSNAPILRGIGMTVGIGLALSLMCALTLCGSRGRSTSAWNRWV